MKDTATFKFRMEIKDGKITGVAYSNRRIHGGLHTQLNKACHDAVKRFNGDFDWQEVYIKFYHNGKYYEQVKSKYNREETSNGCYGCVFSKIRCDHPYFDTKPYCTGKIYIETKQSK